MATDVEIGTVNIKQAKELCKQFLKYDIPSYLHGPPGVGKSEIWEQIAHEEKIGLIDIRLGQKDVVDLTGLPNPVLDEDGKGGRTIWLRPDMWPDEKRDGKRGIILFDEMSDTNKPMQSAAYQIILNRTIGPHKLLKGWYPCAAGNRRGDKAAAQAISTALANRFAHLFIAPDKDAWKDWAYDNGIAAEIIAFISWRGELLHSMEGANILAFPTPRSWSKVNKVMGAPDSVRHGLIRALIGDGPAHEFREFLRTFMNCPSYEDIIKDPKRCTVPDSPGGKYAVSVMLAKEVTRNDFDKAYTYAQRLGREFEICTMLDATKRKGELCDTSTYVTFSNRNKDLQLV